MPVEKRARAAGRPGGPPPPLLECLCLGLMGTHVVSGEVLACLCLSMLQAGVPGKDRQDRRAGRECRCS